METLIAALDYCFDGSLFSLFLNEKRDEVVAEVLGESEKRFALDKTGNISYNKKTPYIQWKSDALAWANNQEQKLEI